MLQFYCRKAGLFKKLDAFLSYYSYCEETLRFVSLSLMNFPRCGLKYETDHVPTVPPKLDDCPLIDCLLLRFDFRPYQATIRTFLKAGGWWWRPFSIFKRVHILFVCKQLHFGGEASSCLAQNLKYLEIPSPPTQYYAFKLLSRLRAFFSNIYFYFRVNILESRHNIFQKNLKI